MRAKIIGTGSALPKKIVTNDELSKSLDTSHEWIFSRTGIKQRHVANPKEGETLSDLGTKAAKNALAMAKLEPLALDLILVATATSDYRLPSSACLIQEKLGAKNAACLDLNAACAGSIYGLDVAEAFIKSGKAKNVLLVTAELLSQYLNWQDRNTAVLFGDGASAAVLTKSSDERGFIDIELFSDGSLNQVIAIPHGGSLHPTGESSLRQNLDKITMNGRETYKFAVKTLVDATINILEKNNLSQKDIAFVVPHQANLRIIEAIAERVEIGVDKFLINLDMCANTSSASLLLAYDEALRAGKLKENDKLLMLAIGSGFVWGAGLYCI